MSTKTVLGFVGSNQNGTLTGAVMYCFNMLHQYGYAPELIDLCSPDAKQILINHVKRQDIAFAFGLQGVGSHFDVGNSILWTEIRKPYIALHYDHPCYKLINHVNDSPYVANLYNFASFLEVKERYLPSNQISHAIPLNLVPVWSAQPTPFAERPIKLLYLKSGVADPELDTFSKLFPPSVGDPMRQQLERAEKNPNLSLCDLANEILMSFGHDFHDLPELFWNVVRYMDYFLRRARAIKLAEWLKMQEGAVIIGDGWDFIDKTHARAVFKPAMPSDATLGLYDQAQFVCNTNPYGRDIIHERILHGLSNGCCVFSDTNQWLEMHGIDLQALTLFDWNKPLEDQLYPHLNDMEVAARAAAGGFEAYNKAFPYYDIGKILIDTAAEVSAKCST